jgi:hypothetical protein
MTAGCAWRFVAASGRLTTDPMVARRSRHSTRLCVLALAGLTLALVGCGTSGARDSAHRGSGRSTTQSSALASATVRIHPHAVEPSAGAPQSQATSSTSVVSAGAPAGSDPTAHAPPLASVRRELHLEYVAAHATSATYINPLHYVTCCGVWERTDQGVDATMPVGAPILAPSRVKILGIEPGWYAGQPLIYFELLGGPQAGKIQYVAEEITALARSGSILQQGQPIARFAASGTGIEYGWSTPSGVTLAVATTGYEEGQITPAGRWMRAWLNALGANAGPNT